MWPSAWEKRPENCCPWQSCGLGDVYKRQLEGDVKDRFSQIGELLYATHTGAPTESEVLLVKLQEIDGLKAEIARMQAEIRKEEEAHTCPTCGAFVKEGDAFCGACGGKL